MGAGSEGDVGRAGVSDTGTQSHGGVRVWRRNGFPRLPGRPFISVSGFSTRLDDNIFTDYHPSCELSFL